MRLWDSLEARKPGRKIKRLTKSSKVEHAAERERVGPNCSAGVKSEGVRDYISLSGGPLKLPKDRGSNG